MTRSQSDAREERSVRTLEEASDLNPRFKLIFFTVIGLTVLALILNVVLAIFGSDSEHVTTAAEACSTTYKMGFGAIVAVIGGKTA